MVTVGGSRFAGLVLGSGIRAGELKAVCGLEFMVQESIIRETETTRHSCWTISCQPHPQKRSEQPVLRSHDI